MSDDRRGAYAPPSHGDDDYEDEGVGARRGAILLVVAVGVLIAFAGVVWSAYNQGVREGGREAPPRIAADDRPFKTVPADPGGYQTPDQDVLVYDEISGQERPVEEGLAQPDEEPIEIEPLDEAQDRPPQDLRTDEEPIEPPAAEEAAEESPAETPDEAVEQAEADTQVAETETAAEDEPVDLAAVAEEESEAKAGEAPAADVAQPTGGAWLVQLAALRSEEEARATWSRVQGSTGGMLSGLSPDIQRADLGEKGVYYRLRVPGFATKGAADSFCAQLKAQGQDCLIVGP